jgi:hypothetical protein
LPPDEYQHYLWHDPKTGKRFKHSNTNSVDRAEKMGLIKRIPTQGKCYHCNGTKVEMEWEDDISLLRTEKDTFVVAGAQQYEELFGDLAFMKDNECIVLISLTDYGDTARAILKIAGETIPKSAIWALVEKKYKAHTFNNRFNWIDYDHLCLRVTPQGYSIRMLGVRRSEVV